MYIFLTRRHAEQQSMDNSRLVETTAAWRSSVAAEEVPDGLLYDECGDNC